MENIPTDKEEEEEGIGLPEDRIREWLNLVSSPGSWFEHANEEPVQEEDEHLIEGEVDEEALAKVEASGMSEDGDFVGEGLMTFANGDYFEGEFLGHGRDRKGILTRLSNAGALTEGSWISGKLSGYCEVEFMECGEWSQSLYKKGLKVKRRHSKRLFRVLATVRFFSNWAPFERVKTKS